MLQKHVSYLCTEPVSEMFRVYKDLPVYFISEGVLVSGRTHTEDDGTLTVIVKNGLGATCVRVVVTNNDALYQRENGLYEIWRREDCPPEIEWFALP